MFRKNRNAIVILILILLFMNGCSRYVKYKPVVVENHKYIVVEEELSDEMKENIVLVLTYLGEDYKINKNKDVLIKRSLWNDKDLLWNYTLKAQSEEWLKNQKSFRNN